MAEVEIEVDSPPIDGISSVEFSPTSSNNLLVSSWDNHLHLYDLSSNVKRWSHMHMAPVLDCSFSDDRHAYSGGLDTWVRMFDFESEKADVLGAHEQTVSSVVFAHESNFLVTGSWDRSLRTWDHRQSNAHISSLPQPERVYAMDITGPMLVVATAGRFFSIYDVRKMEQPVQRRESSLKFQTRTVACMADGKGYASASVEGRISVEYFDSSPEWQAKKYAFKCHRQTVNGEDTVWPVNALAFHPIYNTFASGGSDATISLWDHLSKKRLRQFTKYPNAITALAFSKDGTKLATGVSYAWDEGEEGRKAPGASKTGVYVRNVGDEVKPKAKSG